MPAALSFPLQMRREERVVWVAKRPVTFDQWLELMGEAESRELVDGILVEKPTVQYDHMLAERWLGGVLEFYAEDRNLGIIMGSRSAVRISGLRGRMPDLLFIREANRGIIQQKAVYGAPDLVIEFRSPNDYASDIAALETDYRAIRVPEIVFVDMRREIVRVLRLESDEAYREETLSAGETLRLDALDDLVLQTDWILREPRPNRHQTLEQLLAISG